MRDGHGCRVIAVGMSAMKISFALAAALAATSCKKADPAAAPTSKGSAAIGSAAAGSNAAGSATGSNAVAGSATGSNAAAGSATGSNQAAGSATGSGAATGSAAAATSPLSLAPYVAAVGDKRVENETMNNTFTLETPKGPVAIVNEETKNITTETLEVTAGLATKLKVTYTSLAKSQTTAGEKKDKPVALTGKAYIVWLDDGALKATTADGGEVSKAELAELADDHVNLGKPQPMELIVASRPWTIAETYEVTAAQLAELNAIKGGPGKPTATKMALTLTAVDDTVATFTMTTELKLQGQAQLTMTPTGVVKVERARNRSLELRLSGPMEGSANGMPAKGTSTNTTIYTY